MSARLLSYLLVWLGCWEAGECFKMGAPGSACEAMVPFHGENRPQSSRPPYSLAVSANGPDGRFLVSLDGTRDFAGFFIQARDALSPSTQPVGSFLDLPEGIKSQCGPRNNGGITHKNNAKKQKVEVEWQAPSNFDGEVRFLATVVYDYNTYWTGITSQSVKIRRSGETDAPSISTIEADLYNGCGSVKLCVTSPENCLNSMDCKAAVSIAKDGDKYEVEMISKDSKYVAFGISSDNKMGGDSVLECVMEDDSSLKAYRSWNIPNAKQNKRLDIQDGFIKKKMEVFDNMIYCKLSHDSTFESEDTKFDLERNPYYVLLAAGSGLKVDSVGYHDIAKMTSQSSRLLSDLRPSTEYDNFYNDCGSLKNCLGFPSKCVLNRNCQAVVSVLAQGSKFQFEMKANSESYVAVGLSLDTKMGGDSVVECFRDQSSGGRVKASMSWNIPGQKANTRNGVNQFGINLLNSSYNDGVIYCKFIRDTKTTVQQMTFDLMKDKYYLLLASGSSLKDNSVGFHDLVYTASGEARLLSDVGEFTVASKLLLRLHGAFMIAAWIGAASIGIVLARYYKQTWVGSSLCAKDLWFAWHRFFMLLTWCLTLAGFALIFVETGEWVSSSLSQTHAIIGCITTVLCFIQPIGAAFRPHPTARNRPLFNWLHWAVGNSAHILSIVTIFFAVPISKAELPEWMDWILVAFVTFYVIVHLLLSFSSCLSDRSSGKRVNSFPMKDMTSRAAMNSAERKQDAPHSGFRRFLLFIHMLGITLFVIAIVIIVVLAPISEQWKILQDKIMSL